MKNAREKSLQRQTGCSREPHIEGSYISLQGFVLCMQLLVASWRIPLPLYIVLGLLLNEADALQHIGDVIDATLLDLSRNFALSGAQVLLAKLCHYILPIFYWGQTHLHPVHSTMS